MADSKVNDDNNDEDSTNKGYLIALVRVCDTIKIYGSSTDRNDCDEIIEINGKSFKSKSINQHLDIVNHVRECIKLRNIQVRIKKSNIVKINHEITDNKSGNIDKNNITDNNINNTIKNNINNNNAIHNKENIEIRSTTTKSIDSIDNHVTDNFNSSTLDEIKPILLDVFVIGSNAHDQLKKFFQLTNIHPHNQNNLELVLSTTAEQICQKARRCSIDNPQQVSNKDVDPNMASPDEPMVASSIVNLNPTVFEPNSSMIDSSKDSSKLSDHANENKPSLDTIESISLTCKRSKLCHDDKVGIYNADGTIIDSELYLELSQLIQRLECNLDPSFKQVCDQLRLADLIRIFETILFTFKKPMIAPKLTYRNEPNVKISLSQLLSDLVEFAKLNQENMSEELAELLSIICRHELEAVSNSYDQVAETYGFCHIDRDFNEDEKQVQSATDLTLKNCDKKDSIPCIIADDLKGSLRRVHINKSTDKALGATIKNDGYRIIIGRIICGGLAHESGLLSEGDEIIDVNGVSMDGKNVNQVIELITNIDGCVTMTIRVQSKTEPDFNQVETTKLKNDKIFVRALFDFDGQQEEHIPCKELALSFRKGEILSIIDQSDQIWWQANRQLDENQNQENDPDGHMNYDQLAGLIPSPKYLMDKYDLSQQISRRFCDIFKFMDRKADTMLEESLEFGINDHSDSSSLKKNIVFKLFNCPTVPPKKRHNNSKVQDIEPMDVDNHHQIAEDPGLATLEPIPFYEEVRLYYPNKQHLRPVFLVGPKLIGQRELVARLVNTQSSRFRTPISHTTRQKYNHEREGVDFYFVSRESFEADVRCGRFVESGCFQGQYYGTSIEAVQKIISSGKTCIHIVNFATIFSLRNCPAGSELKPFLVFVRPDISQPQKLRNLVMAQSRFAADLTPNQLEQAIRSIVAEVEAADTHLLAFFDLVINATLELDRACKELLAELEIIEREPQWIPKFW